MNLDYIVDEFDRFRLEIAIKTKMICIIKNNLALMHTVNKGYREDCNRELIKIYK